MNATEQKARERINNTPELKAIESILLYDWPNWTEHMDWIATAPISEILEWAAITGE